MTIGKASRDENGRHLARFLGWRRTHRTAVANAQDLDTALCEYFGQRFFEGGTCDERAKLLPSVSFHDIRFFKNTVSTLPCAMRALRGWTTTGPSDQRLPFPLVLLYVVAAYLVRQGEIGKAFCILIQHNAYLHPGR